jgi:D-lyxose ketol-isomerase
MASFAKAGWVLPPNPKWDVTDLGLGDFDRTGLVLINLAEEPEYCEKLMYSLKGQVTPMHTHAKKKEDIICRNGRLTVELWAGHPEKTAQGTLFRLRRNGTETEVSSGVPFVLESGERVTLVPGVYHAFWAESDGCVVGEISTANDDANDNFFVDPAIGRFPPIEEDEPATLRLVWETAR